MTSHPSSRRRLPARRLGFVLALLLAAAALTTYAGGAVGDPSVSPSPSPGASAGEAGPGGIGRQVFLRDCSWCHGQDGQGTDAGPSLRDVGAQGASFYLRTGRMPLADPDQRVERGPVAYSDTVIDALVGYVASLGNGPPIPTVSAGDPVMGRKLFLSNCAACHSASGTGMVLNGGELAPELFETHATQVAEAIRIGPGPMPRFTEKQLEKEQVDDIVSYVQTLGPRQDSGGAGLDEFGPIVEGLVAWLVLVPVLLIGIRLLGKRAGR